MANVLAVSPDDRGLEPSESGRDCPLYSVTFLFFGGTAILLLVYIIANLAPLSFFEYVEVTGALYKTSGSLQPNKSTSLQATYSPLYTLLGRAKLT